MGNVSVTEKVATQISQNFMKSLAESVTDCSASSTQSFEYIAQAGGNITKGVNKVRMVSTQAINCIANMDVGSIMKSFNKSDFEQSTKQAVSGLPLAINASVESVTQTVVQQTFNEQTIRNIQTLVATSKQSMVTNLQAAGNIVDEGNIMEAVVDQIVKGISDSIVKSLQDQKAVTESKSVTDQLVDGFLSGSTFTKIAMIVVIGGGLIGVLTLVLRLVLTKKQTQTTPTYQYDSYAQYDTVPGQIYGYQQTYGQPYGYQ